MNRSLQILASFALSFLFSHAADAQQSSLSCPAGQEYLQVMHGREDGFDPSGAAEPTSPSPQSVAAITWNSGHDNRYDLQVSGNTFADTFDLGLPADATAAALRITGRFRAADSNAKLFTDLIYFAQFLPGGGAGFNRFAYRLGPHAGSVMSWDINASGMTPGSITTINASDVLDGISAHGFIDVQAQDDISIDYLTVELCYEPGGIDIAMNKTVGQTQAQQGQPVYFNFDFEEVSGAFGSGDRLTVTDTLPNGFQPTDLPNFSDGDDWQCTVTGRPAPGAGGGQEITCQSRPGIDAIETFTIGTAAPRNQSGDFENCADLVVTRSNGGADIRPDNNLNRCAAVNIAGTAPPIFEVSKTLENCQSFRQGAYRCVYHIRIENTGGPYTGELQIEELTNLQVNRFSLFDANRTPIACQTFNGSQPQQLTFSSGTISSARFELCTLPNASIDASTPIELTALVLMEGPVQIPPEPPLNCAVVVMWDSRADGIQTENFPSSCVDALTPATPANTDPRIVSVRDTEFPTSNWAVDHCPDVDVGRGRSTYTAGQTASAGNPAPGYAISYEFDLRIALCHINQTGVVTLDDHEISELNFAFDARGPNSGRMRIGALVVQDGVFYWSQPWANADRSLRNYSYSLDATNFTPAFSPRTSTQHPDFGCDASPLTIGFVTANQIGSVSTPSSFMHQRSAIVDNFSLEVTPGAPCD